MRYFIIVFCLILTCCHTASFGQETDDILQLVLDSVGFSRGDVGYEQKGYWSRFPLDIPYRLTSFNDLFAEPLNLYDYGKTMANTVEKYLEPSFMDTTSSSLYYLTYSLGVDRKLGGFRNYSANLTGISDSMAPFTSAVESLFLLAKDDSLYPSLAQDVRWNDVRRDVEEASARLDGRTKKMAAKLLVNLVDVVRWRNYAFRRCDRRTMERAFKIDDLALTQDDGEKYYSELDDIASDIDYPSLHYAALKCAAIVQEAADSLIKYDEGPSDWLLEFSTPYGAVILIGRGYFDDRPQKPVPCDNTLLVIDFGNDLTFAGPAGANAGIDNPVSVCIDLDGNDIYRSGGRLPSQGAGVLGVGLLYDAAGDDEYIGAVSTQGMGLFGVGILLDGKGADNYTAELSGQGCGYFGIGLCLDAAGDDRYYIYGSGQGYGGIGGGIGVLGDYAGNDFYKGEPSPEVFDLSDYHSEYKINGNGVQGVGFGRRGDITDGHSWAGGVGAIIDISGDDHYLSGNWSLGCAYWFSTGIAYDGRGDDIYESCYFTQGSGAHFCNAILIDEGGNDKHELYGTAGAALGFGWDYTNAFLINIGGEDAYRAGMISIGCAEIRSNAFLIDIGGNDIYRLKSGALGLGAVDYREYYRKPTKTVTYYSDTRSLGCLIDIGGMDKYLSFTDTTETTHPHARDNSFWFNPSKSDSTFGADNYGVGIDVEKGRIPELDRWK
jgi:hypothetical protein